MKISYLCLRPPLDPTQAATGNQVRDAGLGNELQRHGHVVLQIAPQLVHTNADGKDPDEFRKALALHLEANKPDAIIVGYWTLLSDLPETSAPVILDFIAPRLLEAMFQEGGVLQQESQAILRLLPVADHFLVGNQRQADLLLPLLLLAGFDCRERTPISIVPISTSGASSEYQLPDAEVRLISAGVDWPWRQSAAYFAFLENWCSTHPGFTFKNITGSYPGADANSTLLSYEAMQQQFAQSHIGLEVSKRNLEREFSHSFRIIEYLQCGLPVIANSWLPIAPLLREFNAGWLIDEPEQLAFVLQEIQANPNVLAQKADGAKRLAATSLNYRYSSAPLLQYLAHSWQPARPKPQMVPAVSRWWKLQSAIVQLYQITFCRKRPPLCQDILVVTRSDLFPVDHGAAVKIVRTAEALSRHGGRVWLCTDHRREYYVFEQGVMTVRRYPVWLRLIALPRRVALVRLLLKGYPWSNAFLYFPLADASYITRSLYLATRNPVGAYIAEFPAYVRPCRVARKLLGGNVMLVEHNVEYARLKEQIKTLTDRSYEELRRTELFMCNSADVVVTVSDNDRLILMRDGIHPQKIHTIPHGVDVAAFRTAVVDDVRSMYGIAKDALLLVYHGPYSYAPNLQAMQVMAAEILPRLFAQNLKVEVLAIGNKPPRATLHEAIHFTGSVPDLARVLPAADLAVVPLLEGGGTRMKILDYFAAGVPVISTSKGAEGLNVVHGQHLIIANDIDVICSTILAFAADPTHANMLARNAAAFVQESSWDNITARYMPLLQLQKSSQQ